MANPWRGEAELRLGERVFTLRPTFAALVAAEEELGPLFALVERAAEGRLRLQEMAGLFWHCLGDGADTGGTDVDRTATGRAIFSESVAAAGLAHVTPVLKTLIGQILQGR